MNDIYIQVHSDGMVAFSDSTIGYVGENKARRLLFGMDDFVDGEAILEIQQGENKFFLELEKEENKYFLFIPKKILIYPSITAQLTIKKEEEIIYKSEIFSLQIKKSIEATKKMHECVFEETTTFEEIEDNDENHYKIINQVCICAEQKESSKVEEPHNYGEWEINPENELEEIASCNKCGHRKTRPHESLHVHIEEDLPIIETKKNIDGYCEITTHTYKCKECQEVTRVETFKKEHEYSFSYMDFDDICTHCGKTKTEIEG